MAVHGITGTPSSLMALLEELGVDVGKLKAAQVRSSRSTLPVMPELIRRYHQLWHQRGRHVAAPRPVR
jgi:hypothetical protein